VRRRVVQELKCRRVVRVVQEQKTAVDEYMRNGASSLVPHIQEAEHCAELLDSLELELEEDARKLLVDAESTLRQHLRAIGDELAILRLGKTLEDALLNMGHVHQLAAGMAATEAMPFKATAAQEE
jgi:hypothetical protein